MRKLIPKYQQGIGGIGQAAGGFDFSLLFGQNGNGFDMSNLQLMFSQNGNSNFQDIIGAGILNNTSQLLTSTGMGVLGAAAGALTPKYKLPSKSLGTALGAVGGIAKGFGNSIVNQAGDALSGGIMKLAGLNTDKMISGYDQGANAIADVVSRFGPYGMIASLAIKGVNSLFASGIQDINKDERVMASTGFAGSVGDIERAADRYGGGTVGGIGTLFGDKDKAEARIAEALNTQDYLARILRRSDELKEAAANSTQSFGFKNRFQMGDNSYLYNGALAAKRGGRLIKKHLQGNIIYDIPPTSSVIRSPKFDKVVTGKQGGIINKYQKGKPVQSTWTSEWDPVIEKAKHDKAIAPRIAKEKSEMAIHMLQGMSDFLNDPRTQFALGFVSLPPIAPELQIGKRVWSFVRPVVKPVLDPITKPLLKGVTRILRPTAKAAPKVAEEVAARSTSKVVPEVAEGAAEEVAVRSTSRAEPKIVTLRYSDARPRKSRGFIKGYPVKTNTLVFDDIIPKVYTDEGVKKLSFKEFTDAADEGVDYIMGQSNKRSNAFRDKVEEATGEIYDYTRKTDKGTKSLEIVPSKNMKENVVGDHSYDYNGKRESIIRVNAGDDYHFATKDDLVSNIVHEVNHNHNKLTKYFSDPYMLDVPIKEAKKFAKTKLDKLRLLMLEDLLGTDALNTDEAIATANQLRRKLLKNYKSLADPNFDFTKLKDLEVKDIITELDLIGSAYSDLATKSINIDTYDIAKAKEALQYLSIAIPIAAGATVVSEKQGGIVNKYLKGDTIAIHKRLPEVVITPKTNSTWSSEWDTRSHEKAHTRMEVERDKPKVEEMKQYVQKEGPKEFFKHPYAQAFEMLLPAAPTYKGLKLAKPIISKVTKPVAEGVKKVYSKLKIPSKKYPVKIKTEVKPKDTPTIHDDRKWINESWEVENISKDPPHILKPKEFKEVVDESVDYIVNQSNKRANTFRDNLEKATGEVYDYTRKLNNKSKPLKITSTKNSKYLPNYAEAGLIDEISDSAYDIIEINAKNKFPNKEYLVGTLAHEIKHHLNRVTNYFSNPKILGVTIKEAKGLAKTNLDKLRLLMLEDLFGNKLNTDEAIATAEELRRILLKKHKGLSNSNFDFTKLKDLEVKDIIEGLRTISSEYTIAARNFVNSGAYDIEKAKKALLYFGIVPLAIGATVGSGVLKQPESEQPESYKEGGVMNVIPEGALHARKHSLDLDNITKKGIPVITKGDEIVLHAEIEVNEIIFTKSVTDLVEELREQYKKAESKKEKNEIALKLGLLVTHEIIENTDDKTGLIKNV